MSEIITESLKQNIEAYTVKPSIANSIWKGDVSLLVSDKLNSKHAGKLFYLVGSDGFDSKTYGVIKIMPGRRIRRNELSQFENEHKITKEDAKKMWQGKEVLFTYGFKMLNTFKSPITIELSSDKLTIKNIDYEENKEVIELTESLFYDIVVSDDYVSFKDNKVFIKNSEELSKMIDKKMKENLSFSEYISFEEGDSGTPIYRLKLEKIKEDENLYEGEFYQEIEVNNNSDKVVSKLTENVKYVVESMPSNNVLVIQKMNNKISILNKDSIKSLSLIHI